MAAIVCGWCGGKADDKKLCPLCGRDPILPYTQRAKQPMAWREPPRVGQPQGNV